MNLLKLQTSFKNVNISFFRKKPLNSRPLKSLSVFKKKVVKSENSLNVNPTHLHFINYRKGFLRSWVELQGRPYLNKYTKMRTFSNAVVKKSLRRSSSRISPFGRIRSKRLGVFKDLKKTKTMLKLLRLWVKRIYNSPTAGTHLSSTPVQLNNKTR